MIEDNIYSIPARFRRIENLHILLWLLKDICWAMNFRLMGMIMIVPTLSVAFIITWQTRRLVPELLHNLAVVFWITANCLWMTGEFFEWDEGPWGARQLALIPFGIGLCILLYYYIFMAGRSAFRKKAKRQAEELIAAEKRGE